MNNSLTISVPYELPASFEGEVYADLGIWPKVNRYRGLDHLPEYALVVTAIAQLFTAFTDIGKAVQALRRMVIRLRRKGSDVYLTDRDTDVRFVLDERALADVRAWLEIRDVDLAGLRKGSVLRWDAERGRWQVETT